MATLLFKIYLFKIYLFKIYLFKIYLKKIDYYSEKPIIFQLQYQKNAIVSYGC